jgi:DUF4097 and DUF4098 domain-containing protein YvlB
MESKNRNVWIILAVIVVVVCCCAALVAAAGIVITTAGVGWFTTQPSGWFAGQPPDWPGATSLQSERIEESFAAGDAPSLKIDSFAGNVTVQTGQSGVIGVAATKRARSQGDLDRIEVQVSELDGGLVIKTENPSRLMDVAVDLEITAPAGARLDAHTGAGNVDIDGITGEIDAHSGAGNLDVRGSAGTARLDTGAGNVGYQGTPQGDCRFETGAGNITLALPADPNVQVDLTTGMGNIDVDFPVDGTATRQEVRGIIGSGAQGTIYAHTGTGNIDVDRR